MVSKMAAKNEVEKHKNHHKKLPCGSRPKYREARWERAVKVYTINLESKFLLVQGVPALNVTKDLLETFAIYGTIDEYRILDDFPAEEFTKVYWIKFRDIMAARKAKRKLDNRSFFGGILHVSYAPEYESVEETREKLMNRKRVIERKINYARKNSKSEQDSQDELQSFENDISDSAATCSKVKITETTTTSIAHTTGDYNDEPKEYVHNNPGESTFIPPRLPPLTVPAYPSQVSTMSTTLHKPHPSAIDTNKPLSRTTTHPVDNRKSYGYNSDVSFPLGPLKKEVQVCYGPTNDGMDNIHPDDTLTGDRSLDRTVLSIREKLKKVNKRTIGEPQETINDKKKKQRKRI